MEIKLRNTENRPGILAGADISADVIARAAARAALGVDGVLATENTPADGIVSAFGRDGRARGVRATAEDDGCSLHMGIVVRYGERIPEVAWNIQEHVKKTVEDLMGVRVVSVNIMIVGVREDEP